MEALQCNAKLGKLRLIEVPIPKIEEPNHVLVKVSFAGLCGTDLHILSGEFTNCANDFVTICHEFSGVVEDLGDAAAIKLKKGDRVGVDPNRPCTSCKFCRKGEVQHCQDGGTRDGVGVFRNGGMAAFCRVPVDQVHKLTDKVSLEQGALCEPLSCVIHGWDRLNLTKSLSDSARILVIGGGIIGNLWCALLHHHGYRQVTVSEPSPGRRSIIANLETGFKIISPAELAEQEAKLDAETEGFDVIIETSGFPPALEQAIGFSGRGATILVFGCAPTGKPIKLCPEEVFRKELAVIGSLVNPNTYSKAICLAEAMNDRYLDFEKLGIAVYNIKDYENAIATLRRGEISKAVFQIN